MLERYPKFNYDMTILFKSWWLLHVFHSKWRLRSWMFDLETFKNHASFGRMTKTPHSGKTVICNEMLNRIHNDVSYFQQIVEIIISYFIVDLSEYEYLLNETKVWNCFELLKRFQSEGGYWINKNTKVSSIWLTWLKYLF